MPSGSPALILLFLLSLWKGEYLLGSNEVFQTKEKGVKFFLYFCITGIVLVSMISSNVFINNFEHNSHFFLVFLLLTLNKYMLDGLVNGLYLDHNCFLFGSIRAQFNDKYSHKN